VGSSTVRITSTYPFPKMLPDRALVFGLLLGLVSALGLGLLKTRSVLITSRTPKEAHSRSLIAALTWLIEGLLGGLFASLS
jgi:hypothetical protein